MKVNNLKILYLQPVKPEYHFHFKYVCIYYYRLGLLFWSTYLQITKLYQEYGEYTVDCKVITHLEFILGKPFEPFYIFIYVLVFVKLYTYIM